MATPSVKTNVKSAGKLRRGLGSSRKKLSSLFADLILGPKKIEGDFLKFTDLILKNSILNIGSIKYFISIPLILLLKLLMLYLFFVVELARFFHPLYRPPLNQHKLPIFFGRFCVLCLLIVIAFLSHNH